MKKPIEVSYEVFSTDYTIKNALKKLNNSNVLAYDCETQSIYSKEHKIEAKQLLKDIPDMESSVKRLCKMVVRSSGLSNPRLVKVTHFIFSVSNNESIICISNNRRTEEMIFQWLAEYNGKIVVHNSLFDLKIMYNRVGKLPKDYDDTMLLTKTLINDVETWKAKSGLKDLMGTYYDPKWTLIETYDIKDYKDEAFLRYCSIDGAATFLLWEQLKEHNGSN